MERGRSASAPDLLEYTGQVAGDAIGSETNHHEASISEVIIAFGVVLALLLVNRAVNLNDETRPWASEIDDVRTDRMLPTKLPAIEPMISEHLPEMPLARRGPATEIPRSLAPPESSCRAAPFIIHHAAVNLASLWCC